MNKSAHYNKRHIITATEVGEFVYCAKAWQLKREGFTADSPRLEPGRVFHASHGAHLAFAGRLRQAGLAFALVAGLLLIGLLAWYLARA